MPIFKSVIFTFYFKYNKDFKLKKLFCATIISMDNLDTLLKHIQQANDIAITCHVNLDGDTLGSALALKIFIEQNLKKQVDFVGGIMKYLNS